jgi:hypothetical protein
MKILIFLICMILPVCTMSQTYENVKYQLDNETNPSPRNEITEIYHNFNYCVGKLDVINLYCGIGIYQYNNRTSFQPTQWYFHNTFVFGISRTRKNCYFNLEIYNYPQLVLNLTYNLIF